MSKILTKEQLDILVQIIGGTTPDDMDCDGCFKFIAEYAELELANRPIPEAMKLIENHLKNCPCCENEMRFLLDALRNQDGNTPKCSGI